MLGLNANSIISLSNSPVVFPRYTYGEKVTGAYHCKFGVAEKGTQPHFIKGVELTGSVRKQIIYPELAMQIL